MRNALLALLAEGPKHGLLLKQEFESTFGAAWPPVNVGQIYVTLQRLEKDGLLESEEIEQQGRRSKVSYSLTGAGTEELDAWFTGDSRPTRIRDEFFLKLILASRTGMSDPFEILDRRRTACMAELRAIDDAIVGAESDEKATALLLAEGAALRLQADIRWLDLCEQRLAEGNLG